MKKLKNKTLLGFILGAIIFGSIGIVIAEYKLKASQVEFKDGKSVQEAIEDLYTKANLHCPNGRLCDIGTATGATIEGVNERGEQLDASGNVVKDSDNNPVVVTHKGIVYLDPTDLKKGCNASEYASNLGSYDSTILASDGTKSPTELKIGCMKWYAYNAKIVNGKTVYDLILDHNTTVRVPWVAKNDYIAVGGTEADYGEYGNTDKGPVTI